MASTKKQYMKVSATTSQTAMNWEAMTAAMSPTKRDTHRGAATNVGEVSEEYFSVPVKVCRPTEDAGEV